MPDITPVSQEQASVAAEDSRKEAAPSLTKRIRKLWSVRRLLILRLYVLFNEKQEFPILPWKFRWRELFLQEMLRLDGRAEALKLTHCPSCNAEGFPAYRCEDCRGADFCKDCMLRWHRYAPLHNMEVRRVGCYAEWLLKHVCDVCSNITM